MKITLFMAMTVNGLIASEEGGVVRNIGLDSYSYTNNDFVAVNPKVYEDLRELGIA